MASKQQQFQIINEEHNPRAILVGLRTTQSRERFDHAMEELEELADACHIETVLVQSQTAQRPVQGTYIGSGKIGEIKEDIAQKEADLVIFDQTLSPVQFRNLNQEFGVEVMDRTGLILRIFSEQARTREARLQVEHAQLQYTMPRLAGMWTHFGRQGGASGSQSNRGVGETQLELDRRHIERRMAELEKELEAISRERSTQREKRLTSGLPKVALVGYTNAGKSTLMNRLLECSRDADSDKKVREEDKLFATLDTTVRRIEAAGISPFLLSDTVGFINELPHMLVKAFRSTLEEVTYADLLLQVIDLSDPDYRECMRVTEETLREIGAGAVPVIHVYNKVDKIRGEEAFPGDLPFPLVRGESIYMSAREGTGTGELLGLIDEMLHRGSTLVRLLIPFDRGDVVNRLREKAAIKSLSYTEEGTLIEALLDEAQAKRCQAFLCSTRSAAE